MAAAEIFNKGDRVRVHWAEGGGLVQGTVTDVTLDGLYQVRLHGFGRKIAVDPLAAQRYTPQTFRVGDLVQAVFAAEGLWYPAVVKSIDEAAPKGRKYAVAFDGYEAVEHVDDFSLKPDPDRKAGVRTGAPGGRGPAPGSRKEAWVKRKKEKRKEADSALAKVQSSWQSFQKKKGARPVAGSFTGRKRQSIFSAGDRIGGTKQTLTGFQAAEPHKRPKRS